MSHGAEQGDGVHRAVFMTPMHRRPANDNQGPVVGKRLLWWSGLAVAAALVGSLLTDMF